MVQLTQALEEPAPLMVTDVAAVRADLARELHDRVASALTAVLVDMERVKLHAPRGVAAADIEGFQHQARSALNGIREVLFDLRGADGLDHGFVSRLRRELEERARRHPGVDLRLRVSVKWPAVLKARAAEHLLHVVREGVHNALIHGLPNFVEVALDWEAGNGASITVVDDGRGLPAPPETPGPQGMGLTGMRERAAILGGRLALSNRSGGGTRLRLTLGEEVLT
jgi:signal transduction histidine kinase